MGRVVRSPLGTAAVRSLQHSTPLHTVRGTTPHCITSHRHRVRQRRVAPYRRSGRSSSLLVPATCCSYQGAGGTVRSTWRWVVGGSAPLGRLGSVKVGYGWAAGRRVGPLVLGRSPRRRPSAMFSPRSHRQPLQPVPLPLPLPAPRPFVTNRNHVEAPICLQRPYQPDDNLPLTT